MNDQQTQFTPEFIAMTRRVLTTLLPGGKDFVEAVELLEAIDEIERLQSRSEAAERENARLREALDAATDAIAFTVACCTYGSEEQAKVGAYGISHEAFTKIDAFIRKYALDKGEALKGSTK